MTNLWVFLFRLYYFLLNVEYKTKTFETTTGTEIARQYAKTHTLEGEAVPDPLLTYLPFFFKCFSF